MPETDDTDELQTETARLLGELIRFDTVNPPGRERPAIEHLERYLTAAGFDCELYAQDPARPNLVATVSGGAEGPVLGLLGHLDTVLADPGDWEHDPWSGELIDSFVWGRGALDMKNQVAAEAAAGASLVRGGWRPARGALKLIFVSDEETGGDLGAQWLCETHPDAARCDFLINEGAGEVFEYGGVRHYGLGLGEKGIFRFTVTARGEAGHASMPDVGDNALLKLAPVLAALADQPDGYALVEATAALLSGLGLDPGDPAAALAEIRRAEPALHDLIAPLFSVTLVPTMISASRKINVIPAHAELRVDCRVPPGLGAAAARERIEQVLGEVLRDDRGALAVAFTDEDIGTASPADTELGAFIRGWLGEQDPGCAVVPFLLAGGSDSKWFRDAFPQLVAYGFFPQRHMTHLETAPLMHNADERIDVRDLGFAARCYADCAVALLG